MKVLATLLFSCLTGVCAGQSADTQNTYMARMDQYFGGTSTTAIAPAERPLSAPFDGGSPSGNYLASQFAQRRHDWKQAGNYMSRVLYAQPEANPLLLNKAMVLAMGAGQFDRAMHLAQQAAAAQKDGHNGLVQMFLAMEAFKKQDYKTAASLVETMPEGSMSDFISPLLQSWSKAGVGSYDIGGLSSNTIYLYHAILIADYLGRMDQIDALLQQAMGAQGLAIEDLERIADAYTHIGKPDTARQIYKAAHAQWPDVAELTKKLAALDGDTPADPFKGVKSPEQGVAMALLDMAQLLYQEYSDESARVFANIALYLDPDQSDAELLLAHISARNERYEDAIAYYQEIAPGSERFLEARRMAASLMEDEDQTDRALAELGTLYKDYKDTESLIEIGDIYRQHKDYSRAVSTYNEVEKNLGQQVPPEYWHLHYVRGMSYEQLGQWDKAEADLKAALAMQPEHPLVLNYLGYAWADQGINLDKSLEMIRKAAALRPDDGAIIDSLGWVLYRMGNTEQAVPHLEKAVELMPYDPVINDHLGDAYWTAGRKLEAKFQWERAKNHSEDQDLIARITQKLDHGLQTIDIVKEARSAQSGADDAATKQP